MLANSARYMVGLKLPYMALVFILLSSCSGNGFHLRENVSLSGVHKAIAIEGVSPESNLYLALEQAIAEAEGKVVPLSKASSIVQVSDLREGKKIIAYTENRVAREYMVFLRFNYQLKHSGKALKNHLINLDKTLIYDASFVLGKAEEERRILQSLREEAVRLMLLRLQYSKY